MKLLPLLALRLTHPYYIDGRCPDFGIEPTGETHKLLRNHRCSLKPFANGIQVFMPVTAQGAPFVALPGGALFTFQLRLRNPDFALFTELPPGPAPLYTNADLPPGKPAQLVLAPPAGPSRSPWDSTVFAEVKIFYNDGWPQITDGPGEFQISFQAKQARWKYYIVTNRTNGSFQIGDKGTPALVFSTTNRTDLKQQPDATDSTATALAVQYPDLQIWRFVSDDPVPCRQAARKALQLSLDGSPVASALPNPALSNYTVDMLGNGSRQRVNSLFQVVKYLVG
jgi:hypothetical protein